MLAFTTLFLALVYHLLTYLTPVNGQLQLARRLEPYALDKRSSFQGGWALLSSTCAAAEVVCSQVVNAACCPSGTVCNGNSLGGAVACCPDQNLCNAQVSSAPSCANSSWTLWQGSNAGGRTNPFCCEPDQIGVNPEDVSFAVGACVANNVVLPSSKAATSTGSVAGATKTSGGSTPATSAATTYSTKSSTGTSGNPTGSSSTSKSGPSGGIIGGIVAGVVVVIVLVSAIGFLCYRRGRRGNQNRGVDPMHQDPTFGNQKGFPTELTAEAPRAELRG